MKADQRGGQDEDDNGGREGLASHRADRLVGPFADDRIELQDDRGQQQQRRGDQVVASPGELALRPVEEDAAGASALPARHQEHHNRDHDRQRDKDPRPPLAQGDRDQGDQPETEDYRQRWPDRLPELSVDLLTPNRTTDDALRVGGHQLPVPARVGREWIAGWSTGSPYLIARFAAKPEVARREPELDRESDRERRDDDQVAAVARGDQSHEP